MLKYLLFNLANCTENSTGVYNEFFDTTCISHETPLCTKRISSHYLDYSFLKCDSCSIENMFMHLDRCVNNCPSGYKAHDKYCIC